METPESEMWTTGSGDRPGLRAAGTCNELLAGVGQVGSGEWIINDGLKHITMGGL